ncbi:sulfite exporter TauE/SafE family protein [Desulfobaculum bizertense]|uniref:Probable membrane transporter protein n=1 Tax=Desulfobaculum bizertense DSM 18034 TaxID=1121442 RepID=A0A1T4VDT1_9BACT|nr:sulfite exporter TauE/SafE family protein [Desulfobaculum bizertense]SKA62711.1 hypothetical protein SAMN02745702_00008 [Desulfobaculum bizertense DSM 18034]
MANEEKKSVLKEFLGEASLGNYIFWAMTLLLIAVAAKESVHPSWVLHWDHGDWGAVDVAPLMGIGVGLVAGFMGGMVGAFISMFSVPLYTMWLGLPLKVALGTNSLASGVIGLLAAWVHFRKKTPDMKVAASMMVFGLLGAATGAYISLGLPAKTLKLYFSILVFGAACWMAYRAFVPQKAKTASEKDQRTGFLIARGEWKGERYCTNVLGPGIANFFIAILAGLLGVGGGFIFTPVMNAFFGLPMVVAVGTGNFVKVANVGSQFIVRGVADTVIYALAVFAMLGGYFGARLGRRVGLVVDQKYLRIVFAVALFFIGMKWIGIKLF